jgi:hypothetical protein
VTASGRQCIGFIAGNLILYVQKIFTAAPDLLLGRALNTCNNLSNAQRRVFANFDFSPCQCKDNITPHGTQSLNNFVISHKNGSFDRSAAWLVLCNDFIDFPKRFSQAPVK